MIRSDGPRTQGRDGDFRARARAVRAAARSKLIEFRQSRRRGAGPLEDPSVDVPPMLDDHPAAPAPCDDAPEAFAEPMTQAPAETPVAVDPPPVSDAAAMMTVSRDVASFARAAPADTTAAAEPPAAPDPAAGAADDEVAPAPMVAAVDLGGLPGVGPGLVWLLERAGVRSVADLRAAAPVALTERLGLVGRLVDVEALQTLARASPLGENARQ